MDGIPRWRDVRAVMDAGQWVVECGLRFLLGAEAANLLLAAITLSSTPRSSR
jgi:hypothetical protein